MGISEGGEGGGIGVDCSVGTIVWVRRRNGSWWPGRILGPDELSASHLMSPRSGTPVKLLGREDASVDWYNLEKSKRVKAFRCGEFDACIERAEAAQGIPIKKREKYARREDAILHALELEKKQLEMKQRKSGVRSNSVVNKPSGTMEKEFDNLSSETHMKNDEPGVHGKHTNVEPQMLSRKAGLSHEEENIGNSISEQKGQNDNKLGFEEDIPENVPRMRGLQDFGLRIAPSKRKPSQSVDNHMDISNAGHAVGVVSHGGSSKNSFPNKKKRSQGGMMEELLVKKRDRRRPLNQVLQSSPKLPTPPHSFQADHDHVVASTNGEKDYMGGTQRTRRSRCIYLPADSNDSLDHGGYPSEQMPATQFGRDNCLQHPGTSTDEYTSSGVMEVDDSDFSGKVYLETDVDEEANLLTDTKESSVVGAKGCELSANQVSKKFTNLENIEVPLSSSVPELHPQEHTADVSAEIGVSRWHMKGKRNTRNITKRPIDVMDGKVSVSDKRSGSVRAAAYETKGSSLRRARTEASSQRTSGHGFYRNKVFNYGHKEDDLIGKDLGHVELTGYSNRRYSSVLKAARDHGKSHISFKGSGNDSSMISPLVWKSGDPSHAGRRAYREDSDEFYEPVFAARLGGKRRPMLFDVDLKVQASYQGEHVPLVSLMSRLNGKAIIGHPVQIEILEDGSTDALVSRNISGLDKSTACPTSWRTGRRTAMQRVPRSNPSALDGEDAGGLQYTDRESKLVLKKYSGHFNQQVKLSKKSVSQAHRPASGKSQKKSSRKVTVSAQKTRTLSSIGTEPRLSGVNKGPKPVRGGSILGGLIKPGGTVPLVTCVPVKVAYSRICEAVGRPSLADRVRVASPAVKD